MLKPIGATFRSKSINLGNDQIQQVEIAPATDAEIEATRKVMGGEDFVAWVQALLDADLLAKGCRAVAYSYIGPELTMPIYRSGTIGKAKEDLEAHDARRCRRRCASASAAAPGSASTRRWSRRRRRRSRWCRSTSALLYKVMKEAGTHEGTAEQIARLFRDHLGPGRTPRTDAGGRIRIDDLRDGIRPCRRGSARCGSR